MFHSLNKRSNGRANGETIRGSSSELLKPNKYVKAYENGPIIVPVSSASFRQHSQRVSELNVRMEEMLTCANCSTNEILQQDSQAREKLV